MADETVVAPAESTAETKPTEQVRDPQAVLRQNEELLTEVKRLKALTKKADGFDFEKAAAALEAAELANDERLKAAGEFDKLKEQIAERHAREIAEATAKSEAIIQTLRKEKIAAVARLRGILPERVKAAIAEGDLDNVLELNETDFSVRKKGGIGDAKEVDEIFDGLKATAPWLFAADGASGSGAQGSDGTGGGGKTMPHAQWKALSPKDQAAFISSGGKPVE